MAEQFYFQIYWNEIDQEIKFNAIVPPRATDPVPTLDQEANIISDSLDSKSGEDKRLTRIVFYFGPRNPVEVDDPENYRGLVVHIAADEEGPDLYDDKRQRVILAPYVDTAGLAIQTAGRILSRYRSPPREIVFELDAKDSDLWTGDLADIVSRRLQGVDGANETTQFQIISAQELTTAAKRGVYKYRALENNYTGRFAYIGPNTLNDYDVETDANKLAYGFIALDTALFSNGDPAYSII